MKDRGCILIKPVDNNAFEIYSKHNKKYPLDTGENLYVVEDITIKSGETKMISLGIRASAINTLGEEVGFLIMPRSSMSLTPLRLSNSVGLIDSNYRGILKISVDNIKTHDFLVKKGTSLVQAVLFDGKPFSLKIVDTLSITDRDESGWGSTDLKRHDMLN